MKHIFSFKIYAQAFQVKKIIEFYKWCEKMGQTVYVTGKNKVEQIHRLPEMLSVLIANLSESEACLVVVEGNRAGQLKKVLSMKQIPVLT